jgi:hypothetical protein
MREDTSTFTDTAADDPGGAGAAPALDLAECERFADFWCDTTGAPHITLTAIVPDGHTNTTTFRRGTSTLRGWIAARQQEGAGIYFQPNETPSGCTRKPAKDKMIAALCRHADIDPDDENHPLAEERDRLARLAALLRDDPEMPPTVIIDSGNGLQPLWAVAREPLNAPEALARVEAENKAVEAALGAVGTHDVSRLLRLPGTVNFPNRKKQARGRGATQARLLHAAPTRYTAADAARLGAHLAALVAGTGLVRPVAGKKQQERAEGQQGARNGHDGADSDDLLARLHAAIKRNPRLARWWEGDTSGFADQSRSALAFALMGALKRARFSFANACALLRMNPHTAEWMREKGEAAGGRELRRCWRRAGAGADQPPREGADDAGRLTIRVVAGDLTDVVDQAEAALIAADLEVYQRGAFVVRPGLVPITISNDRTAIAQRLITVREHALMEAMTRAARWEKYDGRCEDWVQTDAPMKVVKVYLERVGRWRLPVLTGIVNAPTLRPDGSVLAAPGYDPATGLLFDPQGADFPPIPERPTREDAERALATLRSLIGTFPFVGEADRAVALSAILTACVRRSLRTAPMHGFSAPVAGTGKSMLVDIASVVATGREAAVIAQGKTEEEFEKRLGAQLLAGEAAIAIDNCEAPLGGECLCQALTQPVVRARILGRSEAPELLSNAFVTATGNNLTLVGDLTRRALLCRLDAKCERPELRRFDHDAVEATKANRGNLVATALTVLRAFVVAGRPQQRDPLGSFGEWSRLVRDALIWLGEADPVATLEDARASDPQLANLTAVVEQWASIIGDRRITVRALIDVATRATTPLDRGRPEYTHPDFREALLAVAGEAGVINGRKLGIWLARNQGRVVAGRRIVQAGLNAGTMTWRLDAEEPTKQRETHTEETADQRGAEQTADQRETAEPADRSDTATSGGSGGFGGPFSAQRGKVSGNDYPYTHARTHDSCNRGAAKAPPNPPDVPEAHETRAAPDGRCGFAGGRGNPGSDDAQGGGARHRATL